MSSINQHPYVQEPNDVTVTTTTSDADHVATSTLTFNRAFSDTPTLVSVSIPGTTIARNLLPQVDSVTPTGAVISVRNLVTQAAAAYTVRVVFAGKFSKN